MDVGARHAVEVSPAAAVVPPPSRPERLGPGNCEAPASRRVRSRRSRDRDGRLGSAGSQAFFHGCRSRVDKTWLPEVPLASSNEMKHARPGRARTAARSAGKRTASRKVSRARVRLGPSTSDLVIVSRTLSDLAEFLERRQRSAGRGRVILDRRVAERRRRAHAAVSEDRRRTDRRRDPPNPTEALMRVLGFTVTPAGVPSPSSTRRPGPRPVRATRRPHRPVAIARHRARRRRS
jgi:hypothetical protein